MVLTKVKAKVKVKVKVAVNGAAVELEARLTIIPVLEVAATRKVVMEAVVTTPNQGITVMEVVDTETRTRDLVKANRKAPAVVSCIKPKRCCTTSKTPGNEEVIVAVVTIVGLEMKDNIRFQYPFIARISVQG